MAVIVNNKQPLNSITANWYMHNYNYAQLKFADVLYNKIYLNNVYMQYITLRHVYVPILYSSH